MKNLFYLYLVIAFMALSCSSSDINKEDIQETPMEELMYLTRVSEVGDSSHDYIYEDNRLVKTTLSNWKDDYQSLEYGDDGKINKVEIYRLNAINGESELNGTVTITKSGNKIIRKFTNSTQDDKIYLINENGIIIESGCSDQYSCETVLYEYDELGRISLLKYYYQGNSEGWVTFEYDLGVNPFNTLFSEFGFLEDYQTQFLDHTMQFYLTNLVTKEFDDEGNVLFSARYEKNGKNYPTKAYWNAPLTDESGVVIFEYLE